MNQRTVTKKSTNGYQCHYDFRSLTHTQNVPIYVRFCFSFYILKEVHQFCRTKSVSDLVEYYCISPKSCTKTWMSQSLINCLQQFHLSQLSVESWAYLTCYITQSAWTKNCKHFIILDSIYYNEALKTLYACH